MEFTPINKRISIPISDWECPESGPFNKEMLKKIFNHLDYPNVEKAVRVIVGEPLLNASPSLLFPWQLASCFLSNSMDLLQSYALYMILAATYVTANYTRYPSLYIRSVNDYDLHNGKALVGGLFRHKDLKENYGFLRVYDAIKTGLVTNNETVVENALARHNGELGNQLCQRVRETFQAIKYLLHDFHPHTPASSSGAGGE